MSKNNNPYSDTHIRNTVYSEIGIGIVANIILLVIHISLCFTRHRPKPTDLPIGLLALIHLVMLLINVFLAVDIFTPQGGRWGELICKLLTYLYRLFRVFSICTTCLLSVLQAITLSPRNSLLAKFNHKSSHRNLFFLLFLCVIKSFFGSHLLISIIATPNLTSDNLIYITESCSLLPMSFFLGYVFATMLTFREATLIGIMAVSNGYMVALLCRHQRLSQHLHTNIIPSPELRATQTILLLLSCFVVMSIMDSIINYVRITLNDDPIFYCIQILVAHSYASFSPLVFTATEKLIISVLRYV
ncbi:Vomeronasal type-1 receptor 97 [Sciurus carolinensis]|uniref:Vomeronasal type-1 receptor n=1 Tax=Sciurus carolinensis TaxID=30640 RepID=A0AA41N6W8_SCICA|nr:Vomeronasal type-1 receptor 97 [Sciurus carolinensis]